MKISNRFMLLYAIITILLIAPSLALSDPITWYGSDPGDIYYNNGNVGIGTTSPRKLADFLSTTGAQLRLSYTDDFDFTDFTVDSSGDLIIDPTGGDLMVDGNLIIPDEGYIGSMSDINAIQIELDGDVQFNKNVGIGRTPGGYELDVLGSARITNDATASRIYIYNPTVSSNSTKYLKGLDIIAQDYDIDSGVTESGYRIGLAVQGYVNTADFEGTLENQYAIWARHGHYGDSAGTINYSIGVFIDTLQSASTTINNLYGIYQKSASAKNYFAGNVGIGTTTPDYKLDVQGSIRAEEVKVETGWSDFVFEDNYNLPPLDHVESYIKENKHLPDIPSAKEVKEQGLSVSEMMAKQMQKIEELTLYVIEQNKKMEALISKNSELEKRLATMEMEK